MTTYSNIEVDFQIETSQIKIIKELKDPNESHVIMFFGPSGHGKSRLINYLLGEDVFTSDINLNSVTAEIQLVEVQLNSEEHSINKKYVFVDTQGLCDTKVSDKSIIDRYKKGINNANIRYVNRIIIVLEQGRITEETRNSINFLIKTFDLLDYQRKINVLIVITKCDGIKKEKIDYLKQQYLMDKTISNLITKFHVRLNKTGEFMLVDNIIFIGIPDLDNLEDEIKLIYQKKMENNRQLIWSSFETEMNKMKPIKKWYDMCNLI